ncbi:hypothetical protein AMTRI_Chr03g142910 [Amborella trichopoda]
MLIHSFAIYQWPANLIKEMETQMRNFIWTGNRELSKRITVSWDKVCKPINEGGLGLRRLRMLISLF